LCSSWSSTPFSWKLQFYYFFLNSMKKVAIFFFKIS